MTSKTSNDWPGQRIDHATFAQKLAERRRAAGDPEMPYNDGARRTKSKLALLKAIKVTGHKW